MSQNEWKKCIAITGRLLLAYALIFAQGAWANQSQQARDKADSPPKAAAQPMSEKPSSAATVAKAESQQAQGEEPGSSEAAEKSPDNASHQDIKVHGHWTIEVRNPDGMLVTHREFENSLVQAGASFLASLLGRNYSVSFWMVEVFQSGGAGPCNGQGGASGVQCFIVDPNSFTPAPNIFQNLSVTTASTSAGAKQLILSGTATAAVTSAIDTVYTQLGYCRGTVAPSPLCPASGQTVFTAATVSPAVNVSTGQTIAITVAISFS